MTATVFRKGFSSRREDSSHVLGHTQISLSHSAVSRASLGLAFPGVHEKRNVKKGGRQVQSIKDLIAALTSIRSKESLPGTLIS